jgi:nucleolar protein 58
MHSVAVNHIVDGKLPKGLRKFLKAACQGETSVIADLKLGKAISEKLEISCLNNAAMSALMRGLRSQLSELIVGLRGSGIASMSLGLSHSLSCYKLKFSPDKVDTMIVQAIGFLDDLAKELNTYAMRIREWSSHYLNIMPSFMSICGVK